MTNYTCDLKFSRKYRFIAWSSVLRHIDVEIFVMKNYLPVKH